MPLKSSPYLHWFLFKLDYLQCLWSVLLLLINKKLKSEEIKFKEKFDESVWAQIKLNNNDMLLLGCIYKSPSSSPENLDELNKLLITVSKEKKFSHIMVMGDFNFPKMNY
jgi:hypothetical protein